MSVVFFGSSKYVLPIIDVLNKNFGLELVITTEKTETEPVIAFCKINKIPYLSVKNKDELKSLIINHKSLSLGVVADFGVIIPKEILNLFPKGILNIHPSLLPKYRGSTPVQTAILNGDKKTGVTIIKLDEHVDHGPIMAQETEQIDPADSSQILLEKLFQKSADLLIKVLNDYESGKTELKEQDHKNSTYTKILKRDDGYIDISDSIEINEIERKIRAYFPWPGVWTQIIINDKLVRIKFLPNKKIQVEGKKEMSYKDFINGYPNGKALLEKLSLI